jgi:hypothetical protein
VVSRSPDRTGQEALQALLEIGRALRAGGDLQPVLAAVASAVRLAIGFGTVVINLHRPAWDDFEVVVVEGSAYDSSRRPALIPRARTAGARAVPSA